MGPVVLVSHGVTGAGHAVNLLSIGLALLRRHPTTRIHVILGESRYLSWFERFGIDATSPHGLSEFELVDFLERQLSRLQPSLVLVDLYWFLAQRALRNLNIPGWLLCRQIDEGFFGYFSERHKILFDQNLWERIFTTEPFPVPPSLSGAESLPPLVLRNHDELLSRDEARKRLGAKTSLPVCVISTNGVAGEFDALVKEYDYIRDQGWETVTSTNLAGGGIFPLVDCFNGVDFLICGAGYNSFWEAVWFQKEACFVPQPRLWEIQARRLIDAEHYVMTENGADRLAQMIEERLGGSL